MAPNAPVLILTIPPKLLENDVFSAVLLLRRSGRLNGNLGLARLEHFGLPSRLSACDTHHDLSHSRVGDLGDLGSTVRQDTDSSEKSCWSAVVFVKRPADLLISGAVGDTGGKVVGEAGAANLAQCADVSPV